MIWPVAHIIVYSLSLLLITWGGNAFCRLALGLSGVPLPKAKPDPANPPAPTLRAGRLIGSLERLLIMVGLAAHSWEVMVAVIALKTVARYKELDKRIEAEYFLVGSLASILWAVIVAALALFYDRTYGLDISGAILAIKQG